MSVTSTMVVFKHFNAHFLLPVLFAIFPYVAAIISNAVKCAITNEG